MSRLRAVRLHLVSKVTLFALRSFLSLGLPRAVTTAAATALFIQTFGAARFPVTDVAAAVLAPVVNADYLWLQRRVSLWRLSLCAFGFDAVFWP